jgi:hypothetical protein
MPRSHASAAGAVSSPEDALLNGRLFAARQRDPQEYIDKQVKSELLYPAFLQGWIGTPFANTIIHKAVQFLWLWER